MFVSLTIVTFVIVILGMLLHFLAQPVAGVGRSPLGFIQLKTRAFLRLVPPKGCSLLGILKRLALFVGTLCFAVLLITGFVPVLLGRHLSGYVLMLHVSCAPVLLVCAAFLVLTWAHRHVFVAGNARALLRCLGIAADAPAEPGDMGLVRKACFWTLAFLSLPLTLSILLSMFPLFGTDGQVALFTLHRVTALVFSLVAFVYAYGLMRYTAKGGVA